MGKVVLGFIFALALLALYWIPAQAPSPALEDPQETPTFQGLVVNLTKAQITLEPTPTPTPTPLIFPAEQVEAGQVTLTIPKLNVEVQVAVAEEEAGPEGLVFSTSENPLWISNWGSEIGAEGVAWIYGHRQWGPVPKIFTDLDKLEAGDQIFLAGNGETLSFTVIEVIVVSGEPDIFWASFFAHDDAALRNGERQVALFTCHPWGTDDQRLIVFAQLIP